MSIYNFSSTDSKHYNRICVSLPNHFLSSYVNICVSTFTSNCNIEVMNNEDFIEFKVNNEIYKINMEQYSKLDSASLAPIIEDMIRKKTDKITVSMTNIDTISFICKDSFEITNMSYNMKLITGFYTLTDSKFPIKSESFETQESIIKEDDEDIPLTDITFHDMNLRIGDYLPLQKTINPPTANGYTINYSIDNIDIATIDENGYVLGIGAGETTIKCEVRNPKSSAFVAPDFVINATIKVVEHQNIAIESVDLPNTLELIETQDDTIYPKITPFYATYSEIWISDNPEIATVNNGYIRAIKAGETTIHYQIKNNFDEKIINKQIKITIKSEYADITKYRIVSDTVGYMLSTPILYLLTNIGNSVFFNEIHNQNKIQCGTVCMCLNNSYASSMPIVATQGEIITKCAINATSNIFFTLVDANMREVKLLNPMYITVSVRPDEEQELITPGLLK